MVLGYSCRYPLARTVGMRVRDPLFPSSCFPDGACAPSCCCLFGFLPAPQTSSQSFLPHLLCHLTLLPPRCPLSQPLPGSSPAPLDSRGITWERSPPWQHSCASHPLAAPPCPFSRGEWQPPALSRQRLGLSGSVRRLSLDIVLAVTRVILRAAPSHSPLPWDAAASSLTRSCGDNHISELGKGWTRSRSCSGQQ